MGNKTFPAYTKKELTRLFSDELFASRYLFLLHDSAGKTAKILNAPGPYMLQINDELKKRGALPAFYDFSRVDPGKEGMQALPQIAPFSFTLFGDEMFTVLPMTTLMTHRIGPNLFLGRISPNEFMPNMMSNNITGVVYIDMQNDILLGANLFFHDFFRNRFRRPVEMLNKPVSFFFSPTPTEIQKANLDKINGPALLPGRTETVTHAAPRFGPPLFEWNASFFTLPEQINTLEKDFRLSVTFDQKKGFGPYFILGEEKTAGTNGLDIHGYLAGRDADLGRPVIKRSTLVTACGPSSSIPPQGSHVLQLCKIGSSLFLIEDNTRLAGYCDDDFLHRKEARLSIGIRRGYQCGVSEIRLETWLSDPVPENTRHEKHLVRLKTEEDRFFTLDRFYNFQLSHPAFLHVGGFILTDVSAMQDRIYSLDTRVKSQRKREAKLRKLLETYRGRDTSLIGGGRAMSTLKETARTIAGSAATVLIEGPTGSGKEVLAQFIHSQSMRHDGPFIKVDCATVPLALLESHLFGHEKGAFTGALSQSIGMFEKAGGGTLFLDEVGNLTINMQAKLLQFFNDFTIQRIGGNTSVKLDVRCILASNTTLSGKVKAGTFREDLFFRINVIRLQAPPLKSRIEDIPELSAHFLELANIESKKEIEGFSQYALKAMMNYAWPGNIRELKNVIDRAVIFCGGKIIDEKLLQLSQETVPEAVANRRKKRTSLRLSASSLGDMEALLSKHRGVVIDAARELNIDRSTLYNYLRREKIDLRRFRNGLGNAGTLA